MDFTTLSVSQLKEQSRAFGVQEPQLEAILKDVHVLLNADSLRFEGSLVLNNLDLGKREASSR